MSYPRRVCIASPALARPNVPWRAGPSAGHDPGTRLAIRCLTLDAHWLHTVFTPQADAPAVRSVAAWHETRSVEVVVVRTPACHLCEDAIDALRDVAAEFPLDVRVVELDSKEGGEIVARHRPPLYPAVVIDGRLFSSGRLPRKKLRRMLEGTT